MIPRMYPPLYTLLCTLVRAPCSFIVNLIVYPLRMTDLDMSSCIPCGCLTRTEDGGRKSESQVACKIRNGVSPPLYHRSRGHHRIQHRLVHRHKQGKKGKELKRYVPQKNSVAYALLITLYRAMENGSSFMKKQELIDAAEASGLSRTAIAPDKSKGKPGEYKSSGRDWYTGWSCMKTLVMKGLVVKASNPAKYMLTPEGQEAARECILRSGLSNSTGYLIAVSGSSHPLGETGSTNREVTTSTINISCQEQLHDSATMNFGGVEVDSSNSDSTELPRDDCPTTAKLNNCSYSNRVCSSDDTSHCKTVLSTDYNQNSLSLRACTSFDLPVHRSDFHVAEHSKAMPPFSFGEKFEDSYHVILILDDRENFGSRSRKVVDNIKSQFKVLVEVRRLPVGDGIWIARHRQSSNEYVLDFIVERKKVDDLWSSIRDNRYKDQKLRLQRCGLQKLIYLVEGDPNMLEAAESIKTACITTELEGFDVQRTNGFADTVRKYGYLTQSITQYYTTHFSSNKGGNNGVCLSFNDFIKKCQDLEKMTVGDVFALQLMQVPQVTEDVALAVTDQYPTLLSLAKAYSELEGNARAQEELLKNQSKLINGAASRNIYKLVWGC